MSDQKREQLSALMDDEQCDFKTIDALYNDALLRQTWSRYHLISDCLKGRLPEQVDTLVADRVKASLQDEAVIVTPNFAEHKHYIQRLLKPAAGLAIAASVATVAILGLQQDERAHVLDKNTTIAANTMVKNTPVTFVASQDPVDNGEIKSIENQDQAKLDHYLVNYNEYRSNSGVQAILPYVRIVAYETEE